MVYTDDTVKNVIEQNRMIAQQNNGLIESQNEYLQRLNPRAWYGQKFRTTVPGQFDSDMWIESARNGETDFLISALQKFEEELPKMDISETSGINQWKFYASAGFKDYDTYMLALSLPMYDNTEKKLRTNGLDQSDPNYYEFGEYTDREWAQKMLMNQFDKYEGAMHDQMMMARSTVEKVFDVIGGGLASLGGHLVSGITRFVGDIFGLLDGISRAMTGGNFLDAFDPDNPNIFLYGSQLLDKALYETEMDTLGTKHISAQKAVEEGYSFLDKSSEVYGVGYEGIGREWVGLVDSIGYMLPSILLGAATGGASTAGSAAASGITATMKTTSTIGSMLSKGAAFVVKHLGTITFYSGIFSSNVRENVGMYGLSEAKLNSGNVIGNAILKTSAEAIVEYGLGKILGFTGLDSMIGIGQGTGIIQKALGKTGVDVAKKAAKQATATGIKAFGYAAANLGKDAFKEGLEEVLQDTATGLIDKAFGGDFYSRGAENLSLQNLADSFIIGALSSVIVSTTQNLMVYGPDKGRLFITPEDGSVKRAGIMQTYNYAQSINIMNEWLQTIKDVKVPTEERSTAMMKVSTMMGLMTKVFNAMGTDRVVAAHRLLYSEYEDENTNTERRAEIEQKFQSSNGSQTYAEALVESFFNEQVISHLMYLSEKGEKKAKKRKSKLDKLKNEVKEAATKGAERLHDADVKNIEGVIDEDEAMISDSSTSSTMNKSDAATRLKEFCKKNHVKIVVVDSNATIKIDDTIFASKKLVAKGDVEGILAGSTREAVVNAVRYAMPDNLYQQLARAYRKITKSKDFDKTDVIVALLFDKNFYTQALLRAENLKNVKEAINFLSQFDNIINNVLSEEYQNNELTTRALKTIMRKIHNNMRAGLVIYGTQYVRIDWDSIGKDTLSDEDKKFIKEMVSIDPNVRVSEVIDSVAEPTENKPTSSKSFVDKLLEAKAINQDGRNLLTQLSQSDNINDRLCARVILQEIVSNRRNGSKLVYIPVLSEKVLSDMSYRSSVENIWTSIFGMKPDSITSLYQTTNDIERTIRDIVIKGVEAANIPFDSDIIDSLRALGTNSNQIFSTLRNTIYEITEHEYTLGQDFALVKVLRASDFNFETVKYTVSKTNKNNVENTFGLDKGTYEMANIVKRLIENGSMTVKEFLQMSGNKEIKELVNKIPKDILDIKIELVENIHGEKDTLGLWDIENRAITVSLAPYENSKTSLSNFTSNILDAILHELTHAGTAWVNGSLVAKNARNVNPNDIVAFMGTYGSMIIDLFGIDVIDEIFDYVVKNFAPAINHLLFGTYSNHIDSEKLSKIDADAKADMIYFLTEDEILARGVNDVSLDTLGFTMSTDWTKIVSPDGKKTWTAKKTSVTDKKPTQALIIRRETEKISRRREIQEFMKNAADEMKYEDGTAKIFYRGTQKPDSTFSFGRFFSSSPFTSMEYAGGENADISSNVCNIPQENLLSIGNTWVKHWTSLLQADMFDGIDDLILRREYINDTIGVKLLQDLKNIIEENDVKSTDDLTQSITMVNKEYAKRTNDKNTILIKGCFIRNVDESEFYKQKTVEKYNPNRFADDLIIFDKNCLKRLDNATDSKRLLGLLNFARSMSPIIGLDTAQRFFYVLDSNDFGLFEYYNRDYKMLTAHMCDVLSSWKMDNKLDISDEKVLDMASNIITSIYIDLSNVEELDMSQFDVMRRVFDINSHTSMLRLSTDYEELRNAIQEVRKYLKNDLSGQESLKKFERIFKDNFGSVPKSPEEENAILAYTTGHKVDDVDLSRFYDFLAWYRENVKPSEYGFDYETDMEEEYKNPNRYVQPKPDFIGDKNALKKAPKSDDTDKTDEKKKKRAKGNVYSVADERSRYLSNREAINSNMRYFIKPGKPIQAHPRIIDFIAGTPDAEKDPEGFKKLDGWLQKHIKAGDLTYDSLMNYVKTTALMTDFSWQSVCKLVFRNEAAASLTFKQARDLILHGEEYAKDSYFLEGKYEVLTKNKVEAEDESVKKMSYDEIKKKHDEISELIKTDLTSQKTAVKAFERVDDSTVNMLYGVWPFLNAFDGTFKSLAKTYNWCRMISSTQRMLDQSMTNYLEGSASDKTDNGSPVKVSTKHQFWYDTPEADKFYKENVVNEDLDFSIDEKRQFLKDEYLARYEATHKQAIERIREQLMAMEFDDEEEDIVSLMSEAPDSHESNKKSQTEQVNAILQKKIEEALRKPFEMIDEMSEDDVNRNMLVVLANENKRTDLYVTETQAQARKGDTRQKSRMDTLRLLANRVGGKLVGIGQKTFWNKVPAEIRDNVNQKTGKFNYNTINKLRGLLDAAYSASSMSEHVKALKELYNELSETGKNDKDVKTLIMKIQQETNENSRNELIKSLREKVLAVEADYLIEKFRETNETLKSIFKKARDTEKTEQKLKKESEKLKAEKETKVNKDGKNLKEKTTVIYVTEVKDQRFNVKSSVPHTNLVQTLLDTEWNKKRKYQIKYIVDEDEEYYVANGTKFYRQNAEAFTNADMQEVAETARYFLDSEIEGSEDDVNKFAAIRFYTLGYIYHESRKGGTLYIDDALREQIRQKIEQLVHNSAVLLAHWKMVINKIDPVRKGFKQALILSGYEVPDELTDRLFEAAERQDVREIDEVQKAIMTDIREHQKQEKADRRAANLTWKERMKTKIKDPSLLRRITAFRSMMMLSSPMTALRNLTSNIFVTTWNRVGEKLGNNLFKKTKGENQLSLKAPVTQRITTYINERFIDNGLFDQLVSNITKYNPTEAFKDPNTGKPTRETIIYKMLLQSMYGKYYQENAFNTNWLNSVHKLIMKLLSDNSFVRRASIRYFGKILAERNYDAVNENREVNDAIMQDFGTAVGLALSDYAHSSSFFSKIDQLIAERGDVPYFLWKLVMPFANTTQLWFQKAIDLSPIGLAKSIYKMCTLEKQIILADTKFESGKSSMSPELTEYLARRGIGQGIIGTILWGLGALLAGLGFIRLDDDDYGIPKLHIGDLTVDVSSIFGSSSLLAGGALISQIAQKGFTWDSLWTALSSSAYVYLDQWPILDMLQYDMSADNFGYGVKTYFEQMALSFIPNLFSWLASAADMITGGGTLKKTTFIGKAAAKIPFLGPVFNEKKIDPYTGDDGSFLDALGRFIPYLSFEDFTKSDYEKQALKRGLKKTQLKGQWNINGQNFNVSKKELQYINERYGNWNAKMFNDFYNNRLSMTVEDAETGKRVTKKFSQMNDEEIKSAIRQIMSKNSITAKILAWTRAGHKYYASATDFQYLRSIGITKNVYRGTNGFVK